MILSGHPFKYFSSTHVCILVILCLAYVLFFLGLGDIALWDPDEPRQAIMAQEMIARSDYIHPYLNGQPYLEKPPLYSWLIVLAAKFTGSVNELASRSPAAFSAALLLLITFLLCKSLKDQESGFLAAIILATNYQFLSNARESVMDMTFALFIGLSVYLGYRALLKQSILLVILSSLFSALAILTKGPVGLIIPLATIIICIFIEKRPKKQIVWFVAWSTLSVALASAWFFLAGENYWKEFILRQNLVRYTKGFDHIEPFYYYFPKLLINFFPWSLALPFAVHHAVKKRLILPLAWFMFTFIFYMFSQSKRAIYLLSCYPACAILCGVYLKDRWAHLVEQEWSNRLLQCFAVIVILVPLTCAVAVNILPLEKIAIFRQIPFRLYGLLAALFAGGIYFLGMLMKRSPQKSLLAFCTYLTIAGIFYHVSYMPIMDKHFKSPRLILDGLPSMQTTPVYTYGFTSAGLIFYVGRPITMANNTTQLMDIKEKNILILEDKIFRSVEEHISRHFLPIKRTEYDKSRFTVFQKMQ
jgi:4-amino-4-deoxy-L-arabinose transferase-like glycosyltransferase